MPTWLASLLLVAVTAVWGWTFVIVQQAIAVYGVMPFLAVRFAIAGAATLLVWGRRLTRDSLVAGAGLGLLLAVGYLFQTSGLSVTTATNAGLITGLFVVFAPLLDRFVYRTRLGRVAPLATGLSLVGMALLTGAAPSELALGDLLVLGCAVAFGAHIAVLSHHAPRHDPRALGTAQMVGVALVFLALWPVVDTPQWPPREVWFALVLTGLVASALAFFVQTAVQRHLPAVRTAVILASEPLFAGLFGYLLAGDRLRPVQLAGGVLIVTALLVSELAPAFGTRDRSGGR